MRSDPGLANGPRTGVRAGSRSRNFVVIALLCACILGCNSKSADQKSEKKGGGGSPEVSFIVVQPTSVPMMAQLPGRVTPFQVSEVRPQVAGVIRRRFFTEGSLVKEGQTLYQIDPSVYEAALAQAQANLESARANLEGARVKAERYRPLAKIQAVSEQDYTDAEAQAKQAAAAVAQTQAQVQTAQINVRFTQVPAPISGRIGRSLFTEGALVTTNQTDPLAVIQKLDPIYVDIQQSSAQLLTLRKALSKGTVAPATARVRLMLPDGAEYSQPGTVQFSEATVDTTTGTVNIRASFPNPGGMLLPGMFVSAVLAEAINTQAFLVPQAALMRDPKGNATVYVVGPDNRATARNVTADRTQGQDWVVTQGLAAGDRVIVQGVANVRADASVRPVPATTTAEQTAPAKDATQNGVAPKKAR